MQTVAGSAPSAGSSGISNYSISFVYIDIIIPSIISGSSPYSAAKAWYSSEFLSILSFGSSPPRETPYPVKALNFGDSGFFYSSPPSPVSSRLFFKAASNSLSSYPETFNLTFLLAL